MSLGAYVGGLACFGAVLAACLGASWLVVRRRLMWMAPEARVLAGALLFAVAIVIAHLLPLLLGILTRGTAIAGALLVLAAATRTPARTETAEDRRGRSSGPVAWALALLTVAVGLAYLIAFLRVNRTMAISDIDSTSFHLPVVARWIQNGSVWRFDDFVPDWGFGAYPQTGNLLQLAVVLPWHDDFLLRLVGPVCILTAAGASYALATEVGAARAPALSFAVLAAMIPASMAAGVDHGQTDAVMAAALVTGALFLVRHIRTRRTAELVLAGLALGLAFGTKWYGPPEVVGFLLVWAVASGHARPRRWRALGDGALVGLIAVLTGGIWLVRNAVVSGDPLFPLHLRVLGVTLLTGAHAASEDVGYSVAHFLTSGSALRHDIWPQYVTSFSAAGAILVAGSAIAAVVGFRRGLAARRRGGIVGVLALAGLVIYLVLPETALSFKGREPIVVTSAARYTLGPLLVAAAACAWAASRRPAVVLAAQVVALAGLAHAISRYHLWGPHFQAVGVSAVLTSAVALLVAAAVVAVVRRRRVPGPALAAGAVLLAIILGGAGRKVQNEFDGHRYRGVSPTFDWIAAHSGAPLRIALAGSTGHEPDSSPYIAFGPRLRNTVSYVGERRDHLLVRAPRDRFLAGLARGHFQALVVGRTATGFPEADWAGSAGWRVAASDPVYRLLTPPGG